MSIVHLVLNRSEWNIDDLKYALERDSSSVNVENEEGKTPLIRVIESDNCSVDVVKLLLEYGADVNQRSVNGRHPMASALLFSRDKPVIKALLDDGADPNTQFYNRSSLCIAFECTNIDVVKLFLNAGCSLHACRMHCSLLHCALNYPRSKSSEAILKLLLESDADVNRVDRQGQTIMCFALEGGAQAYHIQMLLNAGASLDACIKHASAFHCAAHNFFRSPFKTGVVKILLDAGVCPHIVNSEGFSPLQHALKYNHCDFGAILLLLDVPDVDCNVIVNEQKLLHYAVDNHVCRLSILDLLIKRGAQLDRLDNLGDTPLHLAARNSRHGVINLLLEKGSPVNARNRNGLTPLMEAAKWERGSDILRIFYMAGAHIGTPPFSSLTLTFDNYVNEGCKETLETFKMLTKICFLENPDVDIEDWIRREIAVEPFTAFACDCANELERMEQNHGPSLRHFLSGFSLAADNQLEAQNYDLNQLLKIRPDRAFPIFFDIFAARVGKLAMRKKLLEVKVYAVKKCSCSCSQCADRDIFLNYESVCGIIQHLSEVDTLNLILAFFKPCKRADSVSVSDVIRKAGKGNLE